MFDVQIADIDLTMPLADFEKDFQDEISNWGASMNYTVTTMSTKRGKNMYKLVIDNTNSSEFTVVAEQDISNGDIVFHPLILQSINNSFYKMSYSDYSIVGQDEDPSVFFCHALENIATNHNGTFAYIDSDARMSIVSNGKHKNVRSVGLIDSDGNVFACSGAKKLKGDTEDIGFTINQPIGEWLDEHIEIQRNIASLQLDQKMNYIGKWLIQAKLKEEIDTDEFMDIFRQAGIFGFSDQSVLNIYKLIM